MQRVKDPLQCDFMQRKIVLAHENQLQWQKKQIQAPRVFGVMLTEHLVQAGALVPPVLEWCCTQVDHFLWIWFDIFSCTIIMITRISYIFSCLFIMITRISHIFLSHHHDYQDSTYFPVSPSWPPDWSWGGSRWHLPSLGTGLAHSGSKATVWQWRGLYTNI